MRLREWIKRVREKEEVKDEEEKVGVCGDGER